jgi:hypothetical protein
LICPTWHLHNIEIFGQTKLAQLTDCLQLGANHVFLSGDKTFERVAGLDVKILS